MANQTSSNAKEPVVLYHRVLTTVQARLWVAATVLVCLSFTGGLLALIITSGQSRLPRNVLVALCGSIGGAAAMLMFCIARWASKPARFAFSSSEAVVELGAQTQRFPLRSVEKAVFQNRGDYSKAIFYADGKKWVYHNGLTLLSEDSLSTGRQAPGFLPGPGVLDGCFAKPYFTKQVTDTLNENFYTVTYLRANQ